MESLDSVRFVLRSRNREDLANLLSRASVEFVESLDDYYQTFIEIKIQAPLPDCDRLRALPEEENRTIRDVILDVFPHRTTETEMPVGDFVKFRLDLDWLKNASNDTDDLAGQADAIPPSNWLDSQDFRLFISHIAKHKDKATRLKECLEQYAISGFVSHEDINPTLEWQTEIMRALKCMDAMVTIHTKGFQRSWWTQQEIGFALCRSVKVISLKFDEDPTGFIAKNQALARGERRAEEIAKEIDQLLLEDERTRERLEAAKRARSPQDPDHREILF